VASQLDGKVRALVGSAVRDRVKWFYEASSILHAKAQGMLRINALVMTIIGVALSFAKAAGISLSAGFLFGCLIAFVLLAVSGILCFLIVRMSWGFLETLPATPTSQDWQREIAGLADVTDRRTGLFQNAWWLGGIGFVMTCLLAVNGVVTRVL
jgi:hypothetical protein